MTEAALEVEGLWKRYERFELRGVSFTVHAGEIAGFVGRNGAGKTTAIKSLLHQIHPDAGVIRFFGREFGAHEDEIKKQLGFVPGAISFYPKKTLRTLSLVTKRFYDNWDDDAYRELMGRFRLDEDKRADQLSQGMKVKYLLALALSHRARMLILDEPTSGLDPVSRDELLDILLGLREGGTTILFSTQLVSDLERCADSIVYIQNGAILARGPLAEFVRGYRRVSGPADGARPAGLIGCRERAGAFTALAKRGTRMPEGVTVSPASLEEIMIHLEREGG